MHLQPLIGMQRFKLVSERGNNVRGNWVWRHHLSIEGVRKGYLEKWFINRYGVRKPIVAALKHTYQLRGMASTLRMRTTISPGQWQPWTAVSPFLGLISMA